MEWFAIIIPFLVSIIGLAFFKRQITKLEIILPTAVSILLIVIFKFAAIYNNTKDVEYWGSKLVQAEYYEEWDEWIYQTCESCTTDSEGNQDCTTYDCSYNQYHSPHWEIIDEYGRSYGVSQQEYKRLVAKFGNESFKDMHRDYDNIDGDMYYTKWDKSYKNLENITSVRTYKNKPQATTNLFHYESLEEEEKVGLFKYPEVVNHKQQHLLGYHNPKLSQELERINALLATKKEVKLFLLVYPDQPIDISYKQETLWKGGNKNEFIVTIGTKGNEITWCRVISWTENQYSKIYTRDLYQNNKDMSILLETTHKLIPIIEKHFERKHFSDFDYLKIELTPRQLWILFIVTIIVNIIALVYITNNEFNEEYYR